MQIKKVQRYTFDINSVTWNVKVARGSLSIYLDNMSNNVSRSA